MSKLINRWAILTPTHFRTYIFSCVFVVSFGITHSTLAEGAPTYLPVTNLEDADGGADWGSFALRGAEGTSGGSGSAQGSTANTAAEGLTGGIVFLNLTDGPAVGAGGLAIYVNDSDITNLTIGGTAYTEGTLLTEFDRSNAVAGTDFCFNYGGSADVTCITLSKSSNSEGISSSASQTTSSNTSPVANAGADQTVASAASVTLDGTSSSDADSDALTYTWSQTSGTSVTLSSTTAAQPTFTAPTLAVGDADAVLVFSLTVNDGTVNSSADTVTITVEAPSPTPATAFSAHEAEIRQAITDAAQRSLNATIGANRRMNEEALDRFIATRRNLEEDGAGVVGRTNVPFDIGGVLRVDGTMLSTRGDFFAQQGSLDGSSRRLFFGDFDLQHDGDNDSTTATLTARVAWEWMQSNRTMFGYFVGGELAYSDLEGPFTGDQQRVGATIGMYAVHALDEQLFLDGYVTLGAGRNNLEMANDVLALTSDYTTRTATAGAALSGIYEYERYEFRPELAFSYGRTWIGNVGFTGRAYGLVDDTLSLDAGAVTIANLTLRPEVIWALDADTIAESRSQFSFAPRLVCERMIATTRAEACGGGVEFGLSSASVDGLSIAEFRLVMDRVGDSNRSSFALNLEHRF